MITLPVCYVLLSLFSISHHVSDTLSISVEGEKEGERLQHFFKLVRTFAFKSPKALQTLYDAFRLLEKKAALDVLDFLPRTFESILTDQS